MSRLKLVAKTCVTVREYARLTTVTLEAHSLDKATVSLSAFEYLCKLSGECRKSGVSLIQEIDRTSLRLDNYVGVIETPCGTMLEILPKHMDEISDAAVSRQILCKMLQAILNFPVPREVGVADVAQFKRPLHEWVIEQFLTQLDVLIKRGIRFDYQRIEEEQRYLRGQLNVVGQTRQPPGRQHTFQIRHDVFLPDRPENRLIKAALDKICTLTQAPDSWRLAHELSGRMAEIPSSRQIVDDFKCWRNDRLMAHYQAIKPWCELVLGENMPLAVLGETRGMSLLFPMEKLFEAYVVVCIRRQLVQGAQLKAQVASEYLCRHQDRNFFQLKPDLMLMHGVDRWVMDCKWKRVDGTLRAYGDDEGVQKYGLSQSDFYQLFAYGQKYLNGKGEMVLIYPQTAKFSAPLPVFHFSKDLWLWVLPFDLNEGMLLLSPNMRLPIKKGRMNATAMTVVGGEVPVQFINER
jgi:5-methylcytosine-specific restriction enzyme subunit McrC